ncbi:NSFL1 cofactor p47 isoform X1 [Schistocerca nitens]|uniref:NSFL1 cofactor p47 isoform X1 n=1 Tax=Schistocerca nitens TaxID=7011 RepID=UPI0021184275|nr:NSFL1 cofactor p47 isoform X1 [Schistocerca nitens]
MADHDELISQFSDVTGVDSERARFYLESSAWKLEVALASFYENDADDNPIDDDPVEVAPPPPPLAASAPSESKSASRVKTNSRFATVASLHKNDTSSDEEEGQAFYAGGSEHSGQQIVGPGKKKKDIVAEMFKSVQEHGAEVVDPRHPTPGQKQKFSGTGYRLGQTSSDTQVVGGASRSSQNRHTEITLKLWREGFSIDDGPLREYTNPENREFLESVRRGEIPQELLREANGSEVHLNMEDHHHEDFVTSKPKVRAFTGKGHLLGSNTAGDCSPSPATIGITKPMDEKDREANEEQAKTVIAVDQSLPTTTVQIRLADGSRLVGQFNHSHTIGDVRRYIITARPQYEHQVFSLLTTFPSKQLDDNAVTLKQAGILNAAILQRLT